MSMGKEEVYRLVALLEYIGCKNTRGLSNHIPKPQDLLLWRWSSGLPMASTIFFDGMHFGRVDKTDWENKGVVAPSWSPIPKGLYEYGGLVTCFGYSRLFRIANNSPASTDDQVKTRERCLMFSLLAKVMEWQSLQLLSCVYLFLDVRLQWSSIGLIIKSNKRWSNHSLKCKRIPSSLPLFYFHEATAS